MPMNPYGQHVVTVHSPYIPAPHAAYQSQARSGSLLERVRSVPAGAMEVGASEPIQIQCLNCS